VCACLHVRSHMHALCLCGTLAALPAAASAPPLKLGVAGHVERRYDAMLARKSARVSFECPKKCLCALTRLLVRLSVCVAAACTLRPRIRSTLSPTSVHRDAVLLPAEPRASIRAWRELARDWGFKNPSRLNQKPTELCSSSCDSSSQQKD